MDFEKFCSENCVERRGTGTLKWDSLQEIFGDADLLPLWVADMEIQSPKAVRDALIKRVNHGVFGYGRVEDSYYDAFFAWQKEHHGMDLAKENVRFATGVVGSLYAAVRSYTKEGDSVIICSPVYYPFYSAIRENGRQVLECPLLEKDGRYEIDFDRFSQAAEEGKVLLFSSPHNPVGRVWSREELEKLSAICLEKGVLVLSDEIHFDLILGERPHTVFATLSEEAAQNCVVCTAPSKTFNLAGLQTSNIIIPNAKLREKLLDVRKRLGLHGCNILGYQACEAAYRYCEDWLEQLLVVLRENRELVRTFTRAWLPGIKPVELEGTYLQWLDCRALGMDAKALEKFMQEEALWFTDEGYIFGTGGEGFERINLACPTWVLRKALERLRDALERRGK